MMYEHGTTHTFGGPRTFTADQGGTEALPALAAGVWMVWGDGVYSVAVPLAFKYLEQVPAATVAYHLNIAVERQIEQWPSRQQ